MRAKSDDHRGNLEGSTYRELRLLEEMEATPDASQRHLAHRLGVALGVANLVVKNLAKKGYIRASRVSWKRWVYILTPAGISRKLQLTLVYVDRFMDHYRRVRTLLYEDLGSLHLNAESCIAIYGTTELAELMYLVLRDMGVTDIDFFDAKSDGANFIGMPVRPLEAIDASDYAKVMVAFPTDIEARCQELHALGIPPNQIVTLLHSSRYEAKVAEIDKVREEV